jgi:hypothetical protein
MTFGGGLLGASLPAADGLAAAADERRTDVSTSQTLADPEVGEIDDIVDLDRYPIEAGGGQELLDLIDGVRTTLSAEGLVTMPGFLLPAALATAAAEIAATVPHVPIRRQTGSVYQRPDLESADAADARCAQLTWFAGHVTRDMIPPFAIAHRLYVSRSFKRFIAGCVGRDRIFEYSDPLAGLVATVLPPGGRYPWHYDTNEFVLTIMTSRPDRGGRFEYCKDLRTPGDENLDGLARVLAGDPTSGVRCVDPSPGDLQLFLGRYSLHQVTPVAGRLERHVLVLSYADRPGVIGPADRTRSVYGRVTEAHLIAEQVAVANSDGLIL